MIEKIKAKKPILIAGIVILIISVCVIFPFEYNRTNYVADLLYTFLSLALAMFILMYGIMGKYFVKGVSFLLFSAVFSFLCWAGYFFNDFWGIIPAVYAGVPAGIITGLLFLIFNYQFISDENKVMLFIKRLMLYSAILLVVSIVFAKGGDWIFDISYYLKHRNDL